MPCGAVQGLSHFDDILAEADGIILSRGNLGIDLPAEKVRAAKPALPRCVAAMLSTMALSLRSPFSGIRL